jgi:hypothetical protein
MDQVDELDKVDRIDEAGGRNDPTQLAAAKF